MGLSLYIIGNRESRARGDKIILLIKTTEGQIEINRWEPTTKAHKRPQVCSMNPP